MRIHNRNLWIISILYWILSIILFLSYGVKNVNDSFRYLTYAENLKDGLYADPHNVWYFGYVSFIFVIQHLHQSELAIIIAQYVLGNVAVICLYWSGILLFQDTRKAVAAALMFILFIEATTWNSYILCEPVYLSMTCISLYLLLRLYVQKGSTLKYLLTAMVLIVTITMKPTGIALAGATIVLICINIWKKIPSTALRITFASAVTLGFLLLLNRMLVTYQIMNSYQIGEIVYGITSVTAKPEYRWILISPPADLTIPPDHYPPLLKIVLFIVYNPIYWLKLFFTKLFFFIFHIRPYWSLRHNIFVLIALLPSYYFFVRALQAWQLPGPLMTFTVVYVLLHSLSVGITTVDWDGRFLMPLLPVIFLVGSSALISETERLGSKPTFWRLSRVGR